MFCRMRFYGGGTGRDGDSGSNGWKRRDSGGHGGRTCSGRNRADSGRWNSRGRGSRQSGRGGTHQYDRCQYRLCFGNENLNREQIRSKNKETLLEIVNNNAISDELKQDAINKMIAMTDIAERENAAEMLLEAKGFTDVVVSITEDSCDVVLNMGEVTDAKRAQVEDIVKRKTNVSAENVIITPIVVGEVDTE